MSSEKFCFETLKFQNIEKRGPAEFLIEPYFRVINEIIYGIDKYPLVIVEVRFSIDHLNDDGEECVMNFAPKETFLTHIENFQLWYYNHVIDLFRKEKEVFDSLGFDWKFIAIREINFKLLSVTESPNITGGTLEADAEPSIVVQYRDTAFKSRIHTIVFQNHSHKYPTSFFVEAKVLFENEIKKVLNEYPIIKLGSCFVVKMTRNNEEYMNFYIHNTNNIVYLDVDIEPYFYNEIMKPSMLKLEEQVTKGSGWSLFSLIELQLFVHEYNVHNGSSYIPLPSFLAHKKAIVNVRNNDEECFKWAVMAAWCEVENHPERIHQYKDRVNELNFNGLTFPVATTQIEKFEKMNPNVSINVYMFDEEEESKTIYPIRLTKNFDSEKHIHLLLYTKYITNGEEVITKSHYCWIKSLSRLLSSQISKSGKKQFI